MKFQIYLLILLVASCVPLPNATDDPNEMPPDTAVTSPPANDMPANASHENPFLPKPGDAQLTRGNVFLHEKSLMIRESYPPQVSLSIQGDLPTPCHELRVEIATPDQANKIIADAYSVVDPNKACIQVLEPFEEHIDLGTFPGGHYSVWINGELAGEFDT